MKWLSVDLRLLPCVLIHHPEAPSCPQRGSSFCLMNSHLSMPPPHPPNSPPTPAASAAASVGSSQDQRPPEKAVIRIHFFLLCALVHCLSSSVRCNQVNERACNEAIRCSLVRRARHSILRLAEPALPVLAEWTQSTHRH